MGRIVRNVKVGESPEWFIKESREGITDSTISGGEMALASIRANALHIPFLEGRSIKKRPTKL